jgi:hypothetical protein
MTDQKTAREEELPKSIYLNPLNCVWGAKFWAGTVTSERANSMQVEYVPATALAAKDKRIRELEEFVEDVAAASETVGNYPAGVFIDAGYKDRAINLQHAALASRQGEGEER